MPLPHTLQQAIDLHSQKRLEQAEPLYIQCLEQPEDRHTALENLTILKLEQGDNPSAYSYANLRLTEQPLSINAVNNVAIVCMRMGKLREADHYFSQLLPQYKENPTLFQNAALVKFQLAMEGFPTAESLLALAKDGVEQFPESPPLLHNLALSQFLSGQQQAAAQLYGECIRRQPNEALAYLRIYSGPGSRDEVLYQALLEQLQQGPQKDPLAWVNLLFARAHAEAAREDYATAYSYYQQANSALRKVRRPVVHQEKMMTLKLESIKEQLQGFKLSPWQGPNPIFILGMPRSGTTLVEEIVARHSSVTPAGELPLLNEALGALMAPLMAGESLPVEQVAESILEARSYYRKELKARQITTPWYTDKSPGNFRFAGILPVLFPEAKIIHCQRDPVETLFSCYRSYFFEGHGWTTTPADLVDYYHYYQRTMQTWESWHPGRMIEVNYEGLVEQPQAQTQALYGALGWSWQPHYAEFKAHPQRPVLTQTLDQVRQPIHRQGINRVQHYPEFAQAVASQLLKP
ncbi:sulfotransferase [Magnetococcus marinus MC-1]|uniref:Sulfotransferase n=1 Tax=Magnetococcus marinus (strain ATCC BAA-1437 / JCM 17883 / MC-1) TaxID=156889 RepID=A0L8E2_MAGMM|nr:sulfotransferase [Magnetococcus marinus]ABK44235.1 sulfotransferase [Magnetococcus marinus MC-1]